MVGVPTGLPQSRDVPTGSGMAEMFQLLSCMVGLPTGLTQSRDVPTYWFMYGRDVLTLEPYGRDTYRFTAQ